MAAVTLSCHVIINRFLRPKPLLSFSLFKQSTTTTTTSSLSLQTTPFHPTLTLAHSLSSPSSSQTLIEPHQNDAVSDSNNVDEKEIIEEIEIEIENVNVENKSDNDDKVKVEVLNVVEPPSLSIKEKKELASYAHSIGKDLKSQQVGKSGVTDTVITALIETLEKRELLKLKIHNNCPTELDDAVKQIARGTGSVVVSQIGRTVILYRPSLSKMKAEEKKRQTRRVYVKNPVAFQSKGQILRQIGRGRRGSSRV